MHFKSFFLSGGVGTKQPRQHKDRRERSNRLDAVATNKMPSAPQSVYYGPSKKTFTGGPLCATSHLPSRLFSLFF